MRRLELACVVALLAVQSGCWSWDPPELENLVENPGCDEGVEGWFGWQSTVVRSTEGARSGAGACQVQHDRGTDYSMVIEILQSTPPVGTRLQAAAWVRSSVAAGKPAGIALRQTSSSGDKSSKIELTLTNEWRLLTTSHVVVEADGLVEVYLYQLSAQPGDRFEVDDVIAVQDP
jgi:hypothetical protein